MKSFYEFLIMEMPELIDTYDKERNSLDHKTFNPNTHTDEYIGKSGRHDLMQRAGSMGPTYFYALKPNHEMHHSDVDMLVHVGRKGNFNKVHDLYGRSGSTLKAHEFYADLVRHGHNLESSNKHSVGGMKTWRELADNSDINVTHHNADGSERQLHNHRWFKDNYEDAPDDDDKDHSFFRAHK